MRNKYNHKFYNANKKLNLEDEHLKNTKLENNNDYPEVEFANEITSCDEEFERARRERNKEKNLK